MNKIIVFQTDFGLDDAAISAMEGVSYSVSQDLNIRHLTHNIPQYNIFDASYRLHQAISYWPEGTVLFRSSTRVSVPTGNLSSPGR